MNPSASLSFHSYRPAAWLRVSGEDSAAFLQGQFTNDLRNIGPEGVYGLWLDVKGKTLADSFIVRGLAPGEFWVGSYFSPGEVIRRRLEEYVIADDVVVEDFTDGWAGLAVIGAGADAWRAAQPVGAVIFFRGRRAAVPSWECLYPLVAGGPAAAQIAGAQELTGEEVARWRIDAGIPAVPQDIGPADLPNEGGLDEPAISFTKGCYLVKEIMARLKSRGRLRRRLTRVKGTSALPPLPTALWQAGKSVGELRSAAAAEPTGFIGLAMLSLTGLDPTQPLSLAASGGSEIAFCNSD